MYLMDFRGFRNQMKEESGRLETHTNMVTIKPEICSCKPWRQRKIFLQFKIIIKILVSFFRIIWIHMLWMHGIYSYNVRGPRLLQCWAVFRRQNQASTYVRFWYIETAPALKGFKLNIYKIEWLDENVLLIICKIIWPRKNVYTSL